MHAAVGVHEDLLNRILAFGWVFFLAPKPNTKQLFQKKVTWDLIVVVLAALKWDPVLPLESAIQRYVVRTGSLVRSLA